MEHLQHFGLKQDPFSNEPDLRFYFEGASHCDAQRRVERGLRQRKGLTVLTGDGGMGKSLLARRILEALEEEVFEATLLVMLPGAADATGILQRFARQLGTDEPAEDRAGLLGQIYEQLAIVREDGRHAVLMLDDAQIMAPAVFAEISGLANLEYEDRRLLSILFIGSLELDQLIENDASIAPRIDVRVRLQPLDLTNSMSYLEHRLSAVNGDAKILPAAAIETLYKFGRGRPRLLNTLADNALFEAYLAGRAVMEAGDVERAAADLGVGRDPGNTYRQPSLAAPVPHSPPTNEPNIEFDRDSSVNIQDEAIPIAEFDLESGLEAAFSNLTGDVTEVAEISSNSSADFESTGTLIDDETAPLATLVEGSSASTTPEAELIPPDAGERDDFDAVVVELIKES